MHLSHLLLRDGEVGTPDAQQVCPHGQSAVAEVGVFKAQAVRDHLTWYRFVDVGHDGLQGYLRIGDNTVVRLGSLAPNRRCKSFDDGPGVESAVAIRKESPHLPKNRTQEVAIPGKTAGEDGGEIVGKQFFCPVLGSVLKVIDEFDRRSVV